MAEAIQAKADVSGVLAGLDKLGGELATHLARSMCVAGGKVLRDEAKLLAPIGDGNGGVSKYPGSLRDAIYLAYKDDKSTHGNVTYSVTWNSKKAGHGHWLEFGHWKRGTEGTRKGGDKPRTEAQWVPAHPFLRPALDSAGPRAQAAMIERGRERLPELLQGAYQPPDEEFV